MSKEICDFCIIKKDPVLPCGVASVVVKGPIPDPQRKRSFYKIFLYDINRVKLRKNQTVPVVLRV